MTLMAVETTTACSSEAHFDEMKAIEEDENEDDEIKAGNQLISSKMEVQKSRTPNSQDDE